MLKVDWRAQLLGDDSWDGRGVRLVPTTTTAGTRFHDRMPLGAVLHRLAEDELHLSAWETPLYRRALERLLSDVTFGPEDVAVDIGCGDGRFTELLLDLGCKRIVAADADHRPLEALHERLRSTGREERVLLLRAGADDVPLPTGSARVVLAIGVLYYLGDSFESGLQECRRILAPGGVLINSEPDLEGTLYRSMIFEGVEDVVENLVFRRFKEEQGPTDFLFRVFDREEMLDLLSGHGLEPDGSHAIPLLPSVLRIRLRRGDLEPVGIKAAASELSAVFDHLDRQGGLAKHVIWRSVRRG